jgi:small subunit ribosomal protein S20
VDPATRGKEDTSVATKKKVSSAAKAFRQNVKRRDHNRQMRSRLRTALKAIRAALDQGDVTAARQALTGTFSLVDRMANKGIIHKNAAGRYKSRLVRRVSGTTHAA